MTRFLNNIEKYLDNITIRRVKMPTREIFVLLLHDTRTNEYTIILNTNRRTINQQRNSVIHELIHYHYYDFESKDDINKLEYRAHKLTNYYRKQISCCLKAYIEQKIKISNIYDAKTSKLVHAC